MSTEKITPDSLRQMKGRTAIASLTAYDFPMTRLLDEVGIPLIHVGDSVGTVMLGYDDTTSVTMAEMEHHTRAAARARPNGLLSADLPYHSYMTPEEAVRNSKRLLTAGAEAVKAEGGQSILPQVRAIVESGIPFVGHLGMLPQSVREEGGYRIKGRAATERTALLEDARALADAGAFALVLELVSPNVSQEITNTISIPTIGIGSGPHCDGQILVTTDLLGYSPNFIPKHVKPRLNMAESIREAVRDWKHSIS